MSRAVPSDAFVRTLGHDLVEAAGAELRRGRLLGWRRRFLPSGRSDVLGPAVGEAAGRLTAWRLFGGGAVALIGVATLWYSSRGVRRMRDGQRGRAVVPATPGGSQAT